MVKSVPCIEMLLSAHADGTLLNLDGLSPLHMAIEKQLDIGIFERLVESIDDVNMGNMSRSLLTLALCQDSPVREFVIALLNRGASIEGIPSRDWWKTFRPPEENPGDFHHIHISRNMQQTYYIQLCTNISLEFGSPRHRCEAHKKINML
ncbi:hypothetical protein BDV59DRAFT_77774 [Aspergillus ambiguus]|uniref:ankyrin repeat domain-containing protein n=1 Tax=Aspergillus ambiguus TaxID=176160 RepID=UPI003CCD0646